MSAAFPSPEGIPPHFVDRAERLGHRLEAAQRVPRNAGVYAQAVAPLLTMLGMDYEDDRIAAAAPLDAPFEREALMQLLRNLGLDIRRTRKKPHTYGADDSPALYLYAQQHSQSVDLFLLLPPAEPGNSLTAYHVHSGKMGTMDWPPPGQGTMYAVRTQSAMRRPSAAPYGWLRPIVRRFGSAGMRLLFLCAMVMLMATAMPMLVMLAYSPAAGEHSAFSLITIATAATLILLAEWLFTHWRTRTLSRLAARMDTLVIRAMVHKLLYLPAALLAYRERELLLPRIRSLSNPRILFTGRLCVALLEIPAALLMLGVLAMIGGTLAWVPLIAMASYGGLMLGAHPHLQRMRQRNGNSIAQAEKNLMETFRSLSDIRASGMQERWANLSSTLMTDAQAAQLRWRFWGSSLEIVSHTLLAFAALALFYLGGTQVLSAMLNPGAWIASMLLTWRILAPFSALCSALPHMVTLRHSLSSLDQWMRLATDMEWQPPRTSATPLPAPLVLERVGVCLHPQHPPLFSDLSMQVAPGQRIGIIGARGSGKSALLKVILGLHLPQEGTLSINGIDLCQHDPVQWRSRMAYIPQTADFFEGSIAENLRIARPSASEQEIRDALRDAGALDDIESMQEGLHTRLPCASRTSSPTLFAFRLMLARACLAQGDMILCDTLPAELHSMRADVHFAQLLARWHGKRTVFIVSTHEDMIAECDLAVGLRYGTPAWVGTPEEVIAHLQAETHDTSYRAWGR